MVYETRARDRAEIFEQDAFHWRDDGIVIRELHPPKDAQGRPIISTPPILRTVPFLEGRELRINAPLPNTTRGRDVAESMRGPLPLYGGMSVEFAPELVSSQGGLRRIKRAYLDAAALVLRGSYAESTVEVREGLATIQSLERVCMAVTLDAAGLAAALRLGDSEEELAEATRLLALRDRRP